MPVEAFLYGGLSGVLAELISFPLDTSKIRLQVQGQVTDEAFSAIKYRGTFHTIVLVSTEEGVRSLFNGVRFGALRQATYGTLKFGIFFSMKNWWNRRGGSDQFLPVTVAFGMFSGAVSSIITTPIDRMKVITQSTQQNKKRTIVKSFAKVYHRAGFQGLYQGMWPNAKRAAVVNGAEIPCYTFVKDYLVRCRGYPDHWTTWAMAAFCSSAAGVAFSQPFDVAKTRIMQQKRCRPDIVVYRGIFDMMRTTVTNEGVPALWKGGMSAWSRAIPWNLTFYLAMEVFRRFDMQLNKRDEPYF